MILPCRRGYHQRRMGPRCSSAETQVCHRSYIIAAKRWCARRFDLSIYCQPPYGKWHALLFIWWSRRSSLLGSASVNLWNHKRSPRCLLKSCPSGLLESVLSCPRVHYAKQDDPKAICLHSRYMQPELSCHNFHFLLLSHFDAFISWKKTSTIRKYVGIAYRENFIRNLM